MFNLSHASQAIRKAAALAGVKSGKYETIFDPDPTDASVVAKVYNRNYPDGLEILAGEAVNALNYTWSEINQ